MARMSLYEALISSYGKENLDKIDDELMEKYKKEYEQAFNTKKDKNEMAKILLFPSTKTIPYYIMAPAYTNMSAGVRALHLLCHALNQAGQRAFIVPLADNDGKTMLVSPELNTPLIHAMEKDFIAVYPDIIKGNPLNSTRVVRWLLGYPGVCGGDTEFSYSDHLWGYSTKIAKSVGSKKVMCLPVSDPNIFYDNGSERREGTCYYSLKYDQYWGGELLEVTKDSKKLEGTPQELAAILRKSTKCYVYENSSIILEAIMCGCPVELIRSSPQFEELHTEYDWPKEGISWYGEEQNRITKINYDELLMKFVNQLQGFIVETQSAIW